MNAVFNSLFPTKPEFAEQSRFIERDKGRSRKKESQEKEEEVLL